MKREKVGVTESDNVLGFDFWEVERVKARKEQEELEKEKQSELESLVTYEDAKTDNQKLFNLQNAYYRENNKNALKDMFLILNKAAEKIVRKECKEHKIIFSREHKEEIALDATAAVIEQIIKNELKISKSFIAYLFLQVRKTLYNRNKAQKLEDYCVEKDISFLDLSDDERLAIKCDMEGKGFADYKKPENKLQLWLDVWDKDKDEENEKIKLVVIQPNGETEVMSFNKVHQKWGFTKKHVEYAVQTGMPICNIYFDEVPETTRKK